MRPAPEIDAWSRLLRRAGVLAVGGLLLGLGLLLLVTPGPGLLTLAAGLGVLSTEFESLARLRDALAARLGQPWRPERR